jgi:hypothetical protein
MASPALLEAFDRQIAWCATPAPFTARVLARSRQWLVDSPAAAAAFDALSDQPSAAAVPLRWAAALHHLALQGSEPWHSLWQQASNPENVSAGQLDDAIAQAWSGQRAQVQAALALPPQTNEVQRSVALLPGLLHVAAQTGLPLVLLEVGASAGLNLWCDRYRHAHGAWQWGDAHSPLTLRADWRGPAPREPAAPLLIARRAGCDAQPIDLAQPGESLRLASFVWPEQADRLARLHAARAAAAAWHAQAGLRIEALSAAAFVQREMAARRAGHATVLMHSVVWQYIAPDQQAAITQAMQAAGQAATADSPVVWLRLEPAAQGGGDLELRCRLWPGGDDQLLARAHPHGAHVHWLADGVTGGSAP